MLETREAQRYSCDEAVDCQFQGVTRFAFLCDISILGARLQGGELPEVGTVLRVAPTFQSGLRQWVSGVVCWVRRGAMAEVGIRFLQPSLWLHKTWVGRMAKEERERRRSIRVPVEVPVEAHWRRGSHETTTVDLSQGGAQLRLPDSLRPGQKTRLFLCLPWSLVEVSARVVRRSRSVQFECLTPGNLEALDCFLQEHYRIILT